MNSNHTFGQRTKLASAVSSALTHNKRSRSTVFGLMLGSAMLTPVAHAQEAETAAQPNEALEEIVVTGIRGSLRRAADIKRNASGVVDAISAEDIGVFPDTNLAESLQRIPGVSIDRSRGEGSKVTVRGFGPEFNLVTLNGRQMPNHNGDNRSFDFADLASEGIAGLEVYKTGQADVPSGGIGSTINIKTTRPLEAPGLKAVTQVKGVFDSSTETGSDVTPEISGIYSNTFADDTIGFSITAAYQERDSGQAAATVGDYNNFLGIVDNEWGNAATVQQWGGIPRNADQTNRPGNSDVYAVPQSLGYELAEFSRERLNGQMTLQWQASDNVVATVDYTYSEVDFERTFNNYSGWFNFAGQITEYDNGPVSSPIVYTEVGAAPDFAMAAGRDGTKTENGSLGLNVDWQVNDRLALEFDYHDSSSESGASGNNGTASQLAIASFTRQVTTGYFGGYMPIMELQLANALDPNDMIVTGSVFDNKKTDNNIEQTTLRGQFDLTDTSSINFGVQLTDVDNVSQFANVQRDTWGGTTRPGDIADLLTPASSAGRFDQISNGNDPRLQTNFFTFDIDALIARTEALGATQSTGGDCGTGLCPSTDFTTDRRTQEETQALYIQYDNEFEIAAIPVSLRAGLRYEETDVASQALTPTYSSVVVSCVDGAGNPVLAGCNEFSAIPSGQQDFTDLKGEYDFLLPNLDLKFAFTDNLVGRFSYSETITRPSYIDIQGGVTIDTLIRVSGGNATGGNPNLQPLESENIDISFEYYMEGGDYVSVGYFEKEIANFIGRGRIEDAVLFPNLIHPATGSAVTFDVNAPVNNEDASIDGWEIALVKNFGDTGFGVQANATFVDASVAFDNASLETQFALDGLSDSANLVGFYEKDKIKFRLAYNWRDDFYAGIRGASSGTPGPTNVEAFGQWDMSASYEVNDNFTVFLEGINIAEETLRQYGRESLQAVAVYQGGARYILGGRYEF